MLGEQTQGFQKLFRGGGIFLYLLNIFVTAVPKSKQKNFQNFVAILTIVDYRNRLDVSPSLKIKCQEKRESNNFVIIR